jgi:hypothetical protein
MKRAIECHNEGTARVIPIILRPCDWQDSPFSKLQVLLKEGKPVTLWVDRLLEAFLGFWLKFGEPIRHPLTRGLEQLEGYLNRLGQTNGWLMIFRSAKKCFKFRKPTEN